MGSTPRSLGRSASKRRCYLLNSTVVIDVARLFRAEKADRIFNLLIRLRFRPGDVENMGKKGWLLASVAAGVVVPGKEVRELIKEMVEAHWEGTCL